MKIRDYLLLGLLIVFSSWIETSASGQSVACGRAPCSAAPVITTTYTGPGDIQPFYAFYSLRGYNQAAALSGTQKAINISRASDSHACDVLIGSNGNLGNTINCGTAADNSQKWSSFCNATTCSIVTWYDQVNGGSCDAAVLTGTFTLASNVLNGFPAVYSGAGGNVNLQTGSTCLGFMPQPYSISAVVERNGDFTTEADLAVGIHSGSATAFGFFYSSSANVTGLYAGSVSSTVATTDSAFHALQAVFNGALSTISVDGTLSAALNPGTTFAGTNFQIGSNGGRAQTVYYMEIGIIASAMNASTQAAVCHNQYSYYGTPVVC